jgi:hypothetical protein
MDKLEDDVKGANDLYLEIVDISPAENGLYINPGEDIRIEFDRAIDLRSVKDAFSIIDSDNIVFGSDSNIKNLAYSFDEETFILTIKANPYLDGLKQYTVSILNRIRGRDGSALREEKRWSFSTSDAPRGYIEFVDTYTNDSTPDLHIYSQGATFYTIASSEGGINWSTDYQLTGNPTVVSDFDVSGAQGTRSAVVQFRDGFVGQAGLAYLSEFETDTVIYDTTPPTVILPTQIYGNIASPSPVVSPSTAADSLSGVAGYAWTGTNLSFGNAAASSTTVSGTAGDGSYGDLQLTVTDRAGNSASDTMTFIRDTVAPSLPTITSSPTGIDLGIDPGVSYTISGTSEAGTGQYCLGNQLNGKIGTYYSWGSWRNYSSGDIDVDYGYTHVLFRYVDTAGNPSATTKRFDYRVFPKAGTVPSSGGSLTGDISWAPYAGADYYKFYIGTSSRGPFSELRIFVGRIEYPRDYPFVDLTELSLSLYTTYYWYYEAYDASDKLLTSRPTIYSFRTFFK